MSARDGLGLLPFSDYADPDPHGQLRIGDDLEPIERACEACGADPGQRCREWCVGLAAHLDGLPLGDS